MARNTASDSHDVDSRIAELVQCIRQDNALISDAQARIQDAKSDLARLLEARGANWSDETGYARLVSQGRSIHYDTEALDNMLISDPLRYGWLKDYRRESVVPERLQVK